MCQLVFSETKPDICSMFVLTMLRACQLSLYVAAPLRSDNGSSKNAIMTQAEMRAGYGITSHNTRHTGRRPVVGKRPEAVVAAKQTF